MWFSERVTVFLMISYEIIASIHIEQVTASTAARNSRSLIFPPTTPTRLQFICGIGIPVEDLHYESITSGYVLKAEYFLPTNATEFHKGYLKPQTVHRRSSSNEIESENILTQQTYENRAENQFKHKQNNLSTYRWTVYKAMELLADRMGLVGRACVLKSICEVASVPFHQASGILAEVAHIILTPSASIDVINNHSNNEYLRAEMLGRSGATCSHIFTDCQQSLMERFSTLLNFSHKT